MNTTNKTLKITALSSLCLLASCTFDDSDEYIYPENLPDISNRVMAGGETTYMLANTFSYSTPALNLTPEQNDRHMEGDAMFEQTFVSNPAPNFGGLGPIFNSNSCISCHPGEGRAPFPDDLVRSRGFFMRVSLPGADAHGGPLSVPGLGTQVQNRAISGFRPEGRFGVTYTDIVETFKDGTQVVLKKPNYTLIGVTTTIPADILISPRTSMPVYGLGLLEFIPEADLLAAEDIEDKNKDGISGKVNRVWDEANQRMAIGRFGWKANTASLLDEVAGSFAGDLSVTNPYHGYRVELGHGQVDSDDGRDDEPEMTKKQVDDTAFYLQTLAVPAARNMNKASVRNGSRIFDGIGCAACHTPKQRTLQAPINALANQTFYPYTDMLLHDMGEDLADGRPDFLANGREWRTRPLWGIGLQALASGHTHFMHDGRAKNITEAILWHGGEALRSKEIFKKLTKKERADLLEFLNSI